MLRKTTAAVVLAGALALGTASATSLGSFNSPTFAANDTGLLACAVGTETTPVDLLDLLPDIPAVNSTLDTSGETLDLGTLDLTPLITELGNITGIDCVTDKVLDLVFVRADGSVLGVQQGIAVDGDDDDGQNDGLDELDLRGLNVDIAQIADVRVVLRNA